MNNQIISFCKLIKNVMHEENEGCFEDKQDWSYFVNLAKEHNLLPIFIEEAIKYPSYMSRAEKDREIMESMSIVAAQINRTKAFLELYTAFIDNDVYPIVMKGLICRELYGKLADHRPSGDEDILIRLAEYEKAKEILNANGYESETEIKTEAQLEQLQEVSFIHPEKKLHIELHLNPMGRENDIRSKMSDCFANVFDDYRDVEIGGVMVRTMNHQDHILFLILHAFRHFIGGGFGIRQMLDILLYQEQYGAKIDLNKLNETLKTFRANAFWNDMIHIGNLYLGFDLSTMEMANCPQELLEDMIHCGTFGNNTPAARTAERTVKFATGNHLKNKKVNSIEMVMKSIFPSRVFLLDNALYLEKKPWLLPVAWIQRWWRFLRRSYNNEGNLAYESMKISQRRMKLLKKYDLV